MIYDALRDDETVLEHDRDDDHAADNTFKVPAASKLSLCMFMFAAALEPFSADENRHGPVLIHQVGLQSHTVSRICAVFPLPYSMTQRRTKMTNAHKFVVVRPFRRTTEASIPATASENLADLAVPSHWKKY